MSQVINISDSVTFIPSGYTGNTNLSISTSSNPPSNAYTDHTSSTYAQLTPSSTSSNGYIYYTFTITGIPANATITGVSCQAKIRINNTSRVSNTGAQLYTNTTAKGSSQTFASTSTSNIITIDGGSSWTVSQVNNIRLRIQGRKGSSNNTGYIYFYGATLTISYSVQGTQYDIISTLATDAVDSIEPGGLTQLMEGSQYDLIIHAESVDNFKVEDNGLDVTNSLVSHTTQAGSFTFTGNPTSFDSANSIYDSVYSNNNPENGLDAHNSSSRCCVYVRQTAYAEAKLTYNFDCSSIPVNAVITSVTCQAGAACYSSGQYFDTKTLQLYSGDTAKGTAVTITGNGSTNATHNINGGSWTRSELNDAKIVVYIQRGNNTTQASFSFWGATLSISYTVEEETYWIYSIANVSADHTIIISDAIIEIPEEDPQYDYYPITISSINATTEPGRGTTRVIEGTNQTITIYPDDPSIALVTDNGVDITNQLVAHGGTIPTPTVATLSGASYGFTLNNSTGYYTSTNNGVSKSAAVCRVSFNFPVRCLVTINYINYAEATYDFGVFGNIDVALSTNYYAAGSNGATITDSNYKLACNTSSMNTSSVQTITYEVPSGEHYIDIKFSKDDASDANNDTLQWKITNIEALEPNNYYTYTLSNIQESHSLIFIFGDVTYYFVNSSGTNAKLFPSGSMVQLPGDYYTLTIVPDDYSYEVTVTDNNIDVTSQVQKKEEEVTKEGNTYTVVNYIYKLNNIQATHNLIVSCSSSNKIYIKVNNSYIEAEVVYKKVNGSWVEVTDYTDLFSSNSMYIKP